MSTVNYVINDCAATKEFSFSENKTFRSQSLPAADCFHTDVTRHRARPASCLQISISNN